MTARNLRCLLSCALALTASCTTPVVPGDAGRDTGSTDAASVDASTDDAATVADAGSDGGVDPCAAGACDPCDTALALDDADPANAARAMGVCSGLVSAEWRLPDGSAPTSGIAVEFALGHGLLDELGSAVTPREGMRMLALSTGTARSPTDPGFASPSGHDKGYTSGAPVGFPSDSPACPGVVTAEPHDGIGLALTLDVPAGANGFRLLLKHHSFEWPTYVCSTYDDVAAVLVSPAPVGSTNGNVALDPAGNPLSVNASFIDVCSCVGGPPCSAGGRTYACSAGGAELVGTGFDATPDTSAATRWLEVRVPASAGSRIVVALALWDSGDGLLDSTTLVDGFRWITDAPAAPETRVLP